MLNSVVGPAVKGVADFASPNRDKKSTGSDSFGKVFEEKTAFENPKDRDKFATTRDPGRDAIKNSDNKVAEPTRTRTEINGHRESERREPEAEKSTAPKDSGPKNTVKGKSQREQAISKFMDSFESEFGVPPTRIVAAMANLKLDEQGQSPEETADGVIDQLGLDDQDKDSAKNMYIGLLAQLQQFDKAPPVPKPDMAVVTAGSYQRFAEVREQQGSLNKSLQSMNEKFWMNGANAGVSSQSLTDAPTEMSTSDFAGTAAGLDLQKQIQANPDFKIDPSKLNPEMQRALEAVKEANPTASPEVALAALVAAARASKAKAVGEAAGNDSEDNSSEFALKGATSAKFGKADQAQAGDGPQNEMLAGIDGASANRERGFQSSQQGGKQGNSQEGLTAKSTKGEVAAKDKSSKSSEFGQTLRADGMPTPTPLKDLGATAPVSHIANTPGAGKTDAQADIRQIMNQAQYLVKKGGGEMKVEMTPEGMGKVHMKVLVENGKVNIQMSAETNEAKKAIEGGLSELKNSLAAHHLSMDHIKVDVVGATNTDNTAQNQMNQNQGGREQTRQFWNHFSQDFGSQSQHRDNFTDIPSLRGYARPRTDQPLEPIRSARTDGYGAAGKGKGLNLVA